MKTPPVTKEVDVEILRQIYGLIIDLKQNTVELLADHRAKGGEETRAGRAVADMYERDIRACQEIQKYATDNKWEPF